MSSEGLLMIPTRIEVNWYTIICLEVKVRFKDDPVVDHA